jgi:hypothetical protein
VTFLIGVVQKVNENILCRGFLFLLQCKTKAELQLSHCRYNRSRKCKAVQKSPFWTQHLRSYGSRCLLCTYWPAFRAEKQIRSMTSPCGVCVCVCVYVCVCVCVCVSVHACVLFFEQLYRILYNMVNCPHSDFLRIFA